MSITFAPLLVACAQCHLGTGKKKFPSCPSLNLAAEVKAVDTGLKPAYLYDHNMIGITALQNYLQELQNIGWVQNHLLLLDIADNILLVNVEKTLLNLEKALSRNGTIIIDVSVAQSNPNICDPGHYGEICTHISELLNHLTSFKDGKPGTLSVGTIFSPQWNLCTIFGLLLGFPTSYWFDRDKGLENCLTLTPLRVFTVSVSCPEISNRLQFQIYSFSVPECLHLSLKDHLDAWSSNTKNAFNRSSIFTDLSICNRIAILEAVAL